MGVSTSGGGSRVAMSEINVTPFVDVMLVILIIFMITAPMLHQTLDIELPETRASGAPPMEDPFLLIIDRERNLSAGGQSLNLKDLSGQLRAIFETRSNQQLYLQADRSVDYGFVAEVMAEIRHAGIMSIGLVTTTP